MSSHRVLAMGLRRFFRRHGTAAGLTVLSIAIGISSTSIAIGLVATTLWHPLPYPTADRIVEFQRPGRAFAIQRFSYRFFYDAQARLGNLEAVAALDDANLTLQTEPGGTDATDVTAVACSASLFQVLGIAPRSGRVFTRDEETRPAGARVALISEELWHTRFGADPSIVGRTVWLNQRAFDVVGVMPSGLRVPPLVAPPAVWIPLGADPLLDQISRMLPSGWDQSAYLRLWARVRPRASAAQTQAQVARASAPLLAASSGGRDTLPVRITGLEHQLSAQYRGPMYILLAVTLLVALMSLTNAGGLTLTLALERRSEMSIRWALGEQPGQAVARLLLDAIVLATIGTALGGALTPAVAHLLETRVPVGMLPAGSLSVSATTIGLLGIGWVIVVAAALAPAAIRLATVPINAFASSGSRASVGSGQSRQRRALLVAQGACAVASFAILISLFRAYDALNAVPLGFDPDSVIAAELTLPEAGGSPAQWLHRATAMVSALEVEPRVAAAAAAIRLPTRTTMRPSYTVVGGPPGDTARLAEFRPVTPNYFAVLHMRILQGRAFRTSDASRVCVVSRQLVRSAFAGRDALGREIAPLGVEPCRIVGVVDDVASSDLRSGPAPTIYIPLLQMPEASVQSWLAVVARVRSRPGTAEWRHDRELFTRTLRHAAPTLPARITAMRAITGRLTAAEQFRATAMATVTIAALMLLVAGAYGAAATYVATRRRELVTRVALGATTTRLISGILLDILSTGLAGMALGWIAAVLMIGFLRSQVPSIPEPGFDGYLIVTVATTVLLALSTYLPSRAIAHLPPADALRAG